MIDYNAQPNKFIIAPNLIGKFIYGAGTINITNDNKNMYVSKDGKNVSVIGDIITLSPGNTGGEHYHVLNNTEIPAHRHQVYINNIMGYDNSGTKDTQTILNTYPDNSQTTGPMLARSMLNYNLVPKINSNPLEYTDYGGLGSMKQQLSQPSQSTLKAGATTPAVPRDVTFNPVPVNNLPPYYVLTYIMKL
jgi:hypothetical protein